MLSINGYILLLACLCQAKKLPDYITLCDANDPNLDRCIEKHANEALPIFIKDKTLNLPSLSPFAVKLSAHSDEKFQFELLGEGVGLEAAQFRNTRFNFEELEVSVILYVPQIVVTGPYKIQGEILGKEAEANGTATITFDSVSIDYVWKYNAYKKNRIDYLKTLSTTYTYEIKQSNVIKESKEQVSEVNTPLIEIWKEIAKDVEQSLVETIHNLMSQAIKAVTEYASYNEILLF